LRKLGKYMERKVRKTEKISSILTINIKIELIFFLRKNYCPTLPRKEKIVFKQPLREISQFFYMRGCFKKFSYCHWSVF
ncbi:hypothetical protein ACFC5Q_09480, partial [Enterococcus hirae]|uniref:hypothetical protein n=1 Tax=Enterococcus hirae TaxID=1354 RepID=UPI0035DC9E8F